jgi:UPF0716 protein FxsA
MGLLLFLLLIAVPIAELWVIVQVADGIGVIWTLVLLFAISIAGAWLLKQQGLTTWMRLRETTARGEIPTKEVTDGALILLGGALLLTPGFLTDIVGIVLLLPPSRAAVKGMFRKFIGRRAKRWGQKPGVYKTRVVSVHRTPREDESEEGATARTSSESPLPSGERRFGEDGSPDTR